MKFADILICSVIPEFKELKVVTPLFKKIMFDKLFQDLLDQFSQIFTYGRYLIV